MDVCLLGSEHFLFETTNSQYAPTQGNLACHSEILAYRASRNR